MEPIRYLQPATFPPPALQHNSKEVFRKRKCCDTNSSRSNQQFRRASTQLPRRRNFFKSSLIIGILLCLVHAIQTTPVFVDNPSLAQFQSGRNIRHLPCVVRKSGLSGTCMFAIDCIKQNGTHLGTCIDRFYFGSCCQIKDESNFAPEISDNSIDQNTISHFVHESTTLPSSALYKPTTETHQNNTTSSHNSTSTKTTTQSNGNKITITTTTSQTTSSSRPTNVTTTSSNFQSKKPTTSTQSTTHRPSQFVVRTTKRPTTTTKKTTTKETTTKKTTTTTATTTTRKAPTTTKTTTIHTTHKPLRKKPTTTSAPFLTTDGPKRASVDDSFQTTTPPKFFTFQMVETTTPTVTEPTNFVDFTTMHPPTFHTKRPQRPSNHSKPFENKTTAGSDFITTIQTSTTVKPKPSPPIRNTGKPKPTLETTLPTKTTSTTKKPSTKRPKPTPKPVHTTFQTTTTERIKPIVISTTTKPLPLADEIPPTTVVHKKPITTTTTHIHTTHPPTTKPRPTASIEKVPKPTVITTTTTTHKRPASTSTTTTATSTPKPKPATTSGTTTTKITEATTATLAPSKTPNITTTTTTFKPGLITWTNEEAEPGTNASVVEKWEPPQQPAQWLPVSTIAPVVPAFNKTETSRPTTINTTSRPAAPGPTSSTEKIIVSVATSISEAQRNETIKPPKPTKATTTTTTTKATPKPTTSSRPTTSTQPNLSTTTTSPTAAESTTIDYEASVESSTEFNWGTTGTGSTTTGDGVTDDYNSTTIPPTATTLPPNTLEGMDYRQICGRRMFPEPRIVGGSNAAFGRWPWQISLRQWRTSTYLHKCGAALLNENWAITAAHCVDNVPPSDLLLRLGEYDLAEEEEPYGYQERRVQIVASHPQFDPRTFEYDLALLRFYEPVIFQPNIIPVCVPKSDEDFIGQTAFVTGWGRLYEDGPLPSVLQEVAVPVINNTICETMYRSAGYIEHIPHIFICAGWKKGGYDSCEGDSGGPMVIQREDDKRFQLGGVISWGIGCAEANQPGVYTRISEFRDWINQILQF